MLPFALCAAATLAHAQDSATAAPAVPDTATEAQGYVSEPVIIQRVVLFGDRHLGGDGKSNGIYTDFGKLVPGSGWISIGPGYRHWFGHDDAVFDTSGAVSWKGYLTAQAKYEKRKLLDGRVILGSQIMWQDLGSVAYFGSGRDTFVDDRTGYRLRSTDMVGYAAFKPTRDSEIAASLGWLHPALLNQGGIFNGNFPDLRDLFSDQPAVAVPDQPNFLHSEISAKLDNRDFAEHPTRGTVLRVATSVYRDDRDGLFNFRRYEAEAAQFVPLAGSRVVIGVRGWVVGSDNIDGGAGIPVYLQPTIGGSNSLRGYADYRFHDRNMLLLNGEVRFALMTHVDLAAFMDAGSVAPRVSDLTLERRSYGAGVRLHSRKQTFVRFDVARSDEGWRFLFRLTEPLTLSRTNKRTAAAPFVP